MVEMAIGVLWFLIGLIVLAGVIWLAIWVIELHLSHSRSGEERYHDRAGAGGDPDPVAAVRRLGLSVVAEQSAMNQERFVGIVVGITTVAITLLVLGQFEREAEGKVAYDCVDPTERERVRDIALRGIDDGLLQGDDASVRCLAERPQPGSAGAGTGRHHQRRQRPQPGTQVCAGVVPAPLSTGEMTCRCKS